jgi:hypothetical protein
MSRSDHVQFNVRSAFARKRAHEFASRTGMTATQVVEDALRGYVPPVVVAPVGKLVQRGPILVRPGGKKKISLEEANVALETIRERGD